MVDHMMRSWVERRLSCPPTSVDQRGTELLIQTVKAALKHIYIIFSYNVTLIFSFMPGYMMRNAAFLCPLPWLRLACGVLLRVHASGCAPECISSSFSSTEKLPSPSRSILKSPILLGRHITVAPSADNSGVCTSACHICMRSHKGAAF